MTTMVMLQDPKTGEDMPVFKDILMESYLARCEEHKSTPDTTWIDNLPTFELDDLSEEIVEDEDLEG